MKDPIDLLDYYESVGPTMSQMALDIYLTLGPVGGAVSPPPPPAELDFSQASNSMYLILGVV